MSEILSAGLLFIFLVLLSACATQSIRNDPLELSVDATKFVGGPFFQGIHAVGVDAQDETFGVFFFGHDNRFLVVQSAGIYHRLRLFVGAKHHHQIAHHGGFLVVVERYDFFFGEFVERHLHH